MRVPVYVMCAALIVAVKTDKSFLFNGNEPPETDIMMGQRDYPISIELLLPRLLYAKAREQQEQQQRLDSINNNNNNNINRQWMPSLYNPYAFNNFDLNDIYDQLYQDERAKRGRPSLSITNSLEVLRDHMINQISKSKMKDSIAKNRNHLTMIGKRIPSGIPSSDGCEKMFLKKD